MFNSKFLKNCVALLVITLVAGFALGAVNEVTKDPIAKAEEKARLEAYEVVYPDAEFKVMDNTKELLQLGATDSKALTDAGLGFCSVDDVLAALDANGNIIGYVMSTTSPSGYGGDIKVAVGISKEENIITGLSVLSNSETAGLGAKCAEAPFQDQFAGKSANGINYTKTGASTDTEIDAISGATITSNAVTEAVNSAIAFYNSVLKEG